MNLSAATEFAPPETATPETAPPEMTYEACEHCDAPVEETQRYCVGCGTRRKHVHDPAARFLSGATSRSRVTGTARGAVPPRRRSFGLGAALALAAVPLAVAAGILIGHSGNNANSKLLAALRAQKPTVVNVAGGGQAASGPASSAAAAPAVAAPVARLTSTFSLAHGYAVELQTLPASGTTEATVAAAERHAKAKRASAVGLISQADFQVTPRPPTGDYVIFSGQYPSSSAATSALAKLKHAFPSAKVISVSSTSSQGSGKVLATTSYGSAHQVTGFKASQAQLNTGAKVVNQVSKEIGNSYTKSQQGLPDAISVP